MNIRFKIALCLFGFVAFAMAVRLFVLTTINHEYYEKLSQKNATKIETLMPMRGHILDRNGKPLAVNELGFSISLAPRLKQSVMQEQIDFIMRYMPSLDAEKMISVYKDQNTSYNHTAIKIVDFIPYTDMQKNYAYLKQNPYIFIKPDSKRFYPNNTSASHVIGYVSKANKQDIENNPLSFFTKVIGKSGIESTYNEFLQGDASYRKTLINALHKEVSIIDEGTKLEQNNLHLTIDLRLQELIDSHFKEKEGAVIIMDVRNGELLAAGSYPEYDLNDFVDGISVSKWNALLENPYLPLINKLISGQYPPGSVIKMGMALAFLEHAGVSETTIIDTPCFIELGGRKFRDWKCGHGSADMLKAIRSSVDVYFYKLSMRAGINNISSVMHQLGFGEKTEIDLPNEKSGVVPTPEWKLRMRGEAWAGGDVINTSIGQGYFLVTPMQVTRYTALIATGNLVQPHFALKFNGEKKQRPTKDVLTSVQKERLWVLQKGMFQVCNSPDGGTAYWRTRGAKAQIACKTGTAQTTGIAQNIQTRLKESQMEYFARSHGWITAFVPYEDPKYAITIMVEHGGGGGNGGPILVEIVNKLYDLGYFKEPVKTQEVAESDSKEADDEVHN